MTSATVSGKQSLVEQLGRLDSQRLRGYRENLAFYRGQQWPAQYRRRERRLVFNYARAMIDKTASYLTAGMSCVVDEEDGSPAARERARQAEKSLHDVYEANNLAQLDFDAEIDASILGDGAFKVTWDPDERRVRVSSPDVQGLFAWWLGDDVTRLWRIASRYYLSDEEAALLYGDAMSQPPRRGSQPAARKQHNVVEIWTQDEFELWLDGSLLEAKPNSYGFIPFVIFANLREPGSGSV